MSRLKYAVPALFLAATLAAAVVQGRVSGRWTPLPSLDGPVVALAAVPTQVGDWEGIDVPLDDPDALVRAGIQGHLSRRYRNRRSGEEVAVLVVCGRPGPISVHTPDICYRAAGYSPVGEPARTDYALGDRKQPLWGLRFHPPASRAGTSDLEIRWGWLAGDGLVAPENSRVAFAGKPALYKLYVIQERHPIDVTKTMPAPTGPGQPPPPLVATQTSAGLDFLTAFVPALERALHPTPVAAQ